MRIHASYYLVILLFLGCSNSESTNLLDRLISDNSSDFKNIMEHPNQYEVQIIYTQIDRDEDNLPTFKAHTYQTNTTEYFYPASTVKMPTAFMALEKLNDLNIPELDKYTPMSIGAASAPQEAMGMDTTSVDSTITVAHLIKKVFAVSDNDAYNRLYEFIGQQALNDGLRDKGFYNTRIIHRVGMSGFDAKANQKTNPMAFYENDMIIYDQAEKSSPISFQLQLNKQQKGKAYTTNDGEIINVPFDFSMKNYISLADLTEQLRAVLFPEVLPEAQQFNLTKDDYQLLYQSMSVFPQEWDYPAYTEPDNYVKFFIFGADTIGDIPNHIRIFNKVGWAYGYLTDVAYIVDFEKNVEFMLSATIHVNQNQTYNDGVYEYDTEGLPFFEKIGQIVYDYEVQRKRNHAPDLSKFKVW